MPFLQVFTNVSSTKITDELLLHLTDVLAKALSKPKEYMAVQVSGDQRMAFGGTLEPTAQVKLSSIGRLGLEENKVLSALIADELERELGIAPKRAYIEFVNVTF